MKKKNEKPTLTTERQPGMVSYPQMDDVSINSAILVNQLIEFKEAITNKINIETIISVVALWSPLFSADFKTFIGYSAEAVEFGYIVFAFMMSLIIILKGIPTTLISILIKIPLINKLVDEEKKMIYQDDPAKKVENILDKCKRSQPVAE